MPRPILPSVFLHPFLLRPTSRLLPTTSTPTSISHQRHQQRQASSFLQNQPAPPRLPAEQQAEFERLQRAAEAQLSSHNQAGATEPAQQQPQQPLATSRHVTTPSSQAKPQAQSQSSIKDNATGAAAVVSPGTFSGGIRQGAPPEFEGDKNPKTGEVGGPKNEPLRWGSKGDWSYNGRVTDF